MSLPSYPSRHRSAKSLARAFTLFETLLAVAVFGVLAATAYVATTDLTASSRLSKLEGDVSTINTAIGIYLANGGELKGVTGPQDVLDKLKTRRPEDSSTLYAGLRHEMLDKRVRAVMQTPAQAAGRKSRALWNPSRLRFKIASRGPVGVAEFILDDSLAVKDYGTEERARSAIDLNPGDGWIWRHEDDGMADSPKVTPVVLREREDEPPAEVEPEKPAEPEEENIEKKAPEGRAPLSPPRFSISEETLPAAQFPLSLSLENPNDPAASMIIYSYHGEEWQRYEGPFTVEKNRLVVARSISLDPERFTHSERAQKYYRPVLDQISGTVTGRFMEPRGPRGMKVSIDESGEGGSRFLWGETRYRNRNLWYDLGPRNELLFAGTAFSDVSMGERFKVADLDYFNGSILSGSEARDVILEIQLRLGSSSRTTLTAKTAFGLENTVNNSDPYASADFVRFQARQTVVRETVDDVTYHITLEFGNASSQGFTTVSQFHVFEHGRATADLYATITPETFAPEARIIVPDDGYGS